MSYGLVQDFDFWIRSAIVQDWFKNIAVEATQQRMRGLLFWDSETAPFKIHDSRNRQSVYHVVHADLLYYQPLIQICVVITVGDPTPLGHSKE